MRCLLESVTLRSHGVYARIPRASVGTMEESNDESVSYRFAMPVYS